MKKDFSLKGLINIKSTIILIIVLFMINNLEHSTYVYYSISKKQLVQIFGWKYADWFQSILVIIVLDLSVIVWIRLNRYIEAVVFELLILILNLLYYEWPGILEIETNKRIAEFIFASMFCFGISSFAFLLSKLNQNQINAESEKEVLNFKIEELNEELRKVESEKNRISSDLEKAKGGVTEWILKAREFESHLNEAKKAEIELESLRRKDELSRTCEYCGDILDSNDSKRVHKGQCQLNPNGKKRILNDLVNGKKES